MITLKLTYNTTNTTFIFKKQQNYSFAFRKLYNNFHLKTNETFINKLCNKYALSSFEFECLKTDIETKLAQVNTQKINTEIKILNIQNNIKLLNNKDILTKKDKYTLSHLYRHIEYFNKSLAKDIVFGTKAILKQLTHLHNVNTSINKIKQLKTKDILTNKDKHTLNHLYKYVNKAFGKPKAKYLTINEKINLTKLKYNNARLLPISYLGSKHDLNSNRYFKFDFFNNTITYKPACKIKFILTYKTSKQYQAKLIQLQNIKDLKQQPISIKLTHKHIYIIYDEEILNGYGVDIQARKKDVEKIKNNHLDKAIQTQLITDVYKQYYRKQDIHKASNKLSNRYLGIDLNPTNIGCSILDKTDSGFDIVKTFSFDLSYYSPKLKLASDEPEQIYQNNKRKHELKQVIKQIFNIARGYDVANLVIEELDFKPSLEKQDTEFNRQTKNIWYRTLISNLFNKYCNEIGIKKIEINPCYSSFIGNIKYNYIDCINASIEIGRRGTVAYLSKDEGNVFFPIITQTDIDTMSSHLNVARDVQCSSFVLVTWKDYFNQYKQRDIIYRWALEGCQRSYKVVSVNSIKSNIKQYCFI